MTFQNLAFGFITVALILTARAAPPHPIEGKDPSSRMAGLQAFCATTEIKNREAREVMIPIAARILAKKEIAPSLKRWEEVASSVYQKSKERLEKNPKDNNARNPFEKHALIHAYVICREHVRVPDGVIADMKRYVEIYKHRQWFGYGALNYRLMNDGAGFIAAEIWPDLVDSDGLNSEGIRTATKTRLFGYFDEIVRENTEEYGAPTYLGINFSAMKLLADFAKDPEMRKRAALTLDSMLLHVACAWNDGYYTTPASRAKYFGSTMTCPDAMDTTGGIGWLFFGGKRPIDAARMNPAGSFWFTARRSYAPPAIFTAIANDRSKPFTHLGGFQQKIRFSIHHEPGYSLACQSEFVTDPNSGIYKETRRTLCKWVSEKPQSTFAPMQENPQRPYRLKDGKPNAFGYGENPFTQAMQHRRTLLAISHVPEDYPHWRMYAPFTTGGAIIKRVEKDGWIFCHGGSAVFAFRYAQPTSWDKPRPKDACDVLKSEARKNGWVLETAPIKDFAGGGIDAELDRFSRAILDKTRLDRSQIDSDTPRLTYQSLDGSRMEIIHRPHRQPYQDHHRIQGKTVDYPSYPHFGNPWVHQPFGSELLSITHGKKSLKYDFKRWSRTES